MVGITDFQVGKIVGIFPFLLMQLIVFLLLGTICSCLIYLRDNSKQGFQGTRRVICSKHFFDTFFGKGP